MLSLFQLVTRNIFVDIFWCRFVFITTFIALHIYQLLRWPYQQFQFINQKNTSDFSYSSKGGKRKRSKKFLH